MQGLAGYGVPILARGGARRVLGVDIHPGNIRYARRRFQDAAVTYDIADVQAPPFPSATFDVITSSNVFEHLESVHDALDHVHRLLRDGGTFILAVPPITDESGLRDNLRNPYHHSNFFVHEWHARVSQLFGSVTLVAHLPPENVTLNFSDPYPSRVEPTEFRFEARSLTSFPGPDVLTAIFVCERPVRSDRASAAPHDSAARHS